MTRTLRVEVLVCSMLALALSSGACTSTASPEARLLPTSGVAANLVMTAARPTEIPPSPTFTSVRSPTPTYRPTNTPRPTSTHQPTATRRPTVTRRPTATRLIAEGRVTGAVVNLREGPGTQYPVLAKAEEGDLLRITGRYGEGGWWQVEWERGEVAWITDKFVEADEASLHIEAVVAPPTPEAVVVLPPQEGNVPLQGPVPVSPAIPPPPPPGNPGSTNPLTGLPGNPTRLARRPVVVVVNNSPVARPQYGLSAADIVY
jgi:hypothetical protein